MRDNVVCICIPIDFGDGRLERLTTTPSPEHTDFFDGNRPCRFSRVEDGMAE